MSEMLKILLMGLGCTSLLGLGSCMLFTGSMVYMGSRAIDSAKPVAAEKRDPWSSGRSSFGNSKKGVPVRFDGYDYVASSDRYGDPNLVILPDQRGR